MRTSIRYTIVNQDGQPVIRAVRVVYPTTARVAPPPQDTSQPREPRALRERTTPVPTKGSRAARGS
ncbi:MAG: hypothetical protein RMK01_08990 [Thermomicrobium sp.]|nr:hypothetical protein [Thermomicrobium sp.]